MSTDTRLVAALRDLLAEHTPWARTVFAEQRLWMACYCGWNAWGDATGTYNEHVIEAITERPAIDVVGMVERGAWDEFTSESAK